MLRISRIDHVAAVTPDLSGQAELLGGIFGFRPTHSWDNPAANVRGLRFDVPGTYGQRWVLLEPTSSTSSLGVWLDAREGRPGLHHIGAEVPDLAAAVHELERHGLEISDAVPGRWVEASLSPPKYGAGVLWRLRGPGTLSMLGDDDAVAVPERTSDGPALGVLGIDHVCQAFPDRDVLADWFGRLAGFVEIWRTPDDAHPDMADLVLAIPGSRMSWEVIAGRGTESFVDRFVERSGPAAHHVTFQVADWDAAARACTAHRLPTFGHEDGTTDGAMWCHAFIHPKQTGGILVQLYWEEIPGVWARSDKTAPRDTAWI